MTPASGVDHPHTTVPLLVADCRSSQIRCRPWSTSASSESMQAAPGSQIGCENVRRSLSKLSLGSTAPAVSGWGPAAVVLARLSWAAFPCSMLALALEEVLLVSEGVAGGWCRATALPSCTVLKETEEAVFSCRLQRPLACPPPSGWSLRSSWQEFELAQGKVVTGGESRVEMGGCMKGGVPCPSSDLPAHGGGVPLCTGCPDAQH
jgi:hypothetical protein